MQTRDMGAAMSTVIDKFDLKRIVDFLNPVLYPLADTIGDEAKLQFRKWVYHLITLRPESFNADEKSIIDHFDLGWLLSADPFEAFSFEFKNTTGWNQLRQSRLGLSLIKFVIMSRSLIHSFDVVESLLIRPKFEANTASELLIIRICDFDGRGVDIARFRRIVGALDDLTQTLCPGTNPSSTPRVVFLDSGSDLAMSVSLGALAVTAAGLFKYVFDQVVYAKEHKSDARTASILKSAEATAKINTLAGERPLSPHEAKRYRQMLSTSIGKLLDDGAYPDAEQDREKIAQLALPRRDQRLLTDGGPPTDGEGPVDGSAVDME